MEQKSTRIPSLPADLPGSMTENLPSSGDDELDEETLKFISALYATLGPLLPEVSKLQGHQEPPAHLMVDMKEKLRELGSSVTDARKRLLRYNIYLKKRLARAMQEKQALAEQQPKEQMTSEQPGTTAAQRGSRKEAEPGKSSRGAEKSLQEIQETPILENPRLKPVERSHRRVMKLQESRLSATAETSSGRAQLPAEESARGLKNTQGMQRNPGKLESISSHSSLDRSQQ